MISMPFDGIVTRAVTNELQNKLLHGRISKIYQPSETELIFTIRNQRQNHTLLLSIHPTYARFHLTAATYQNPKEPPMFCMLLRKHLVGGFIESIKQDGLERIVEFEIRTVDEIGDSATKCLILELMGRHSNVMLLNDQKEHIIDSLKHVSPLQNRYRTILPGHMYIAPPKQDKLNPLTVHGDEFIKKIDFNAGKLDMQMVHTFTGLSPFITREIVKRANLGSPEAYNKVFLDMCDQINNHDYDPTIYRAKKEDFHVIPMSSLEGEQEHFNSPSDMLDHFFTGKAERDRVKQQARDLYRLLKNELSKNERKLKIHQKTIKKAKRAEKFQRQGELLTAHLHLVNQGDTEVNVVDYYDPEQKEVIIPLQTDKTPSENAQSFFTRYRKLEAAKKVVRKEIIKSKREIAYLEQLIQQLEVAREVDIEEIREELREEGYLKKQRHSKKRKPKKPMPEAYVATDGTPIYVGRNNKQNDYLTHRLAHRHDMWLHTKDIPGSHVVIRAQDPSETTILEAAQLAAFYSKAQQSASVPVDYTAIKHVNKPTGAKPGYVNYDQQKTVYVTPEQKIVDGLRK